MEKARTARSFARWIGNRVMCTDDGLRGVYKGSAGHGCGWVRYDDTQLGWGVVRLEFLKKIYVPGMREPKSEKSDANRVELDHAQTLR